MANDILASRVYFFSLTKINYPIDPERFQFSISDLYIPTSRCAESQREINNSKPPDIFIRAPRINIEKKNDSESREIFYVCGSSSPP